VPDTRSYPFEPDRPAGHLPSPLAVAEAAPVVGDAISGAKALRDLLRGEFADAAVNALAALPFIPATVGAAVKRGRPFFHGTGNATDPIQAAEDIIVGGFSKHTINPELNIIGATSLSSNPVHSYIHFVNKSEDPARQLLQVKLDPRTPVIDLSPHEYMSGMYRGQPVYELADRAVFGIPRVRFNEHEVTVPAAMHKYIKSIEPAPDSILEQVVRFAEKYGMAKDELSGLAYMAETGKLTKRDARRVRELFDAFPGLKRDLVTSRQVVAEALARGMGDKELLGLVRESSRLNRAKMAPPSPELNDIVRQLVRKLER